MKKSILKIIFFILFITVLPILILLPVLSEIIELSTNHYRFNSQITDIYITNNDKVLVKQTIDIKDCIPQNKSVMNIKDLIFYCPICSISDISSGITLSKIKEYKTNIDIFQEKKESSIISHYYYRDSKMQNQLLILQNDLKKNNYKVIFSYELNSKDILSYTDNNKHILLNLSPNSKFNNNNDLFIHLPNNVKILNNNDYLKKQNETTYKVNLKNENIDYKIKLDGNFTSFVSDCPKTIYMSDKQKNNLLIQKLLFILIPLTLTLSAILIIAYCNKKIKIEKLEYERNPKNVIDPILAESIIDGKVDAKNLIMTCLVNLIHKKNLINIDNNYIKLVSTDNLSEIEERILLILFSSQKNSNNFIKSFTYDNVFTEKKKIDLYLGEELSFSNLKNTFKQKNKETLSIYEEFSNIKEIIKNQLYKQNILSKTWDNILKHLKIFSVMLIINMLILISFGITIFVPITLDEPYLLYWITGNILFYIFSKRITLLSIAKIKEINSHVRFIILSVTSFTLFSLIINLYSMRIDLMLAIIILITINLFIYKFSSAYVLTKKGKQEYAKAIMLKKFLLDYSLIEQRNMDSVIVFDDYLIYATAFGIPNKITSKLNENLMNLNIKLQVLSNILTL